MVRETNNVCFGQIAQETQVVVREDNKRDLLKRSAEDVSPPNFSERNSSYFERNSRLATETDSYLRRSNSNSYQSGSNNNLNNNNNNNFLNTPDNRSRTRDRLYRNGPNALGISSISSLSASTLLSERTSSGTGAKINNSRVPPTSWYEAAATYTNGPGGSGNADVSAAKTNHYQTAASAELQATAATTTTNSTTTSSYTAYSFASSPAHNTASTATSAQSRNSTLYRNVPSAGAVQTNSDKESETNLPATPQLLNKNKQKVLKSSFYRSGSTSPTSTTLAAGGGPGAVLPTMTSSSSVAASTPSSSSSLPSSSLNNNNTINNSRSNQTANNSCSSVSSTINSSNTNNSLSGNSSNVTNADNAHNSGSGSSSASGILNAAALAAAASKGSSSSTDSHKHSSNSGRLANSSSNVPASSNTTSGNQTTSASHHTPRSTTHGHYHGRSCTSSSRSHSRSPSSYSSSHSTTSSSSSTASSHSHACSPVGGRDVESSPATNVVSSRSGSRSLQSAVAVPSTPAGLNPSGSNVCGSSSSCSSSSGTPTGNPVVHSEDNRPLAIRVRNLPARSSDTSLKDGLFHEYKKHGKVTWVKVVGQNSERYALVCFKKPEDVEKALEVSHDKLFFGCKIEVEPYQGYDVEDNEFRPYEAELDEYHPKSTRTLFIGNLEKEITASELRQHFECFGEIIEIDIKKQGMSAYAFCQYSDIVSVVKAMRKMDGEHLGNNRIKLGFGKSMPTNCVWIDGIGEKISESHLQSQFLRYGAVSKVVVDRQRQLALVLYEQIQYAQTAVKEMRGATLRGRKLQVDFASRECQDAFYEKLEKQNIGSRFNRYDSQSRSRASSFSRHQNSNDGFSPNNTPGSSSSSSAGLQSATPALSSAIVAGSSILPGSNAASVNTLASVVGQTIGGSTTPARSRGSRSSRHTMDYEYQDSRRFRSCDEYSQGSATSHDEDNTSGNHSSSNINSYSGIGLRSDSPLLSRLGPVVNNSGKESSMEMIELALSRRRCDKSPAKQKGDIRLFQKERAVLLEQLEECPSSGDESIVSPRKRMKIDHHSINSSCGLTQSHSLDEPQLLQHKNSNCDYLLNDSMHRKSEVRRLSECNSGLNKYLTPQQNHHHSHAIQPSPHHHHHQQQLSRRPSIDFMATSSGAGVGGGVSSMSARHNSTSSSSSDHHPQHHQGSSSSSLACKRRRIISSSGNTLASTSSLLSGAANNSSNLSSFANDESHHHTSRGRGHQLHSHHSHEASGGESADGSRPGTPLCDERPEELPTEPRRVPRERPREPMILPLPKFGIPFFQQHRNNSAMGNTISYHHHHHSSGGFSSSSASLGGNNNSAGSSHLHSSSMLNRGDIGLNNNNSHSSLSHSSATATSTSALPIGTSSGSCYLPSPSSRFAPHWRPHHHHHHHHQHNNLTLHGPSGGLTPSSSSSMVSPLRSRSLSSNSSDSDVPCQPLDNPSLDERIRSLDEMYERWSGNAGGNNSAASSTLKRHDFNHTPPTWQHHRSSIQADSLHGNNSDVRSSTNPPTPASRHKFRDIDVNELQPSDIVKSVLAKKSIFDDDLQRLKKNHWYESTSDISQGSKPATGVCTSPGLPNLQATKSPVVGCSTSSNTLHKPCVSGLQHFSSFSPMNSPQASTSPYNSPSASPSVLNTVCSSTPIAAIAKVTLLNNSGVLSSHSPAAPVPASTSPTSAAGTKCLQYPFPTHPPLPNTAAPTPSTQPIPPPPAESSKPSMSQPPLPPTEVLQPPQPPASSPTSSSIAGTSAKPKTSALSKSLSVPPLPQTTAAESRVFTKSVSVPGSTNLGTVQSNVDSSESLTTVSPTEHTKPQQTTTGNSSFQSSKSQNKEDDTNAKPSSHSSSASSADSVAKRSEKQHKHNHRSSEEKKSAKNDRRKNSNALQAAPMQTTAADSSDADEADSKRDRKDRQEKREKEMRRQQDREERERQERERLEQERREKERLEKDRLEAERRENERLEQERLAREERERVQHENERIRKEQEQRAKEEKDRKEKEDKERKKKEEIERRERAEKEEKLRSEKIEREKQEEKEKEKSEQIRRLEEKHCETNSEHVHGVNLLKDHSRRKDNAAAHTQIKPDNNATGVAGPSIHELHGQAETERQSNKENSTSEGTSPFDPTTTNSVKPKSRKNSRNMSPARHSKRRLSPSQDNNNSNIASVSTLSQTDEHIKRIRIDSLSASNQSQAQTNNHSSANSAADDRRELKEHHGKDRNSKHNRAAAPSHKGASANNVEKEQNSKHHRSKHHHKTLNSQGSADTISVNPSKSDADQTTSNCTYKVEDDKQTENYDAEMKSKMTLAHSSEDEGPSENFNTSTPHHNKSLASHHKHKEHGSGHHSRHKSNKREKEHHRDKKRHSTSTGPQIVPNANESVPSTPPSSTPNIIEEETIASPANQLAHKRVSNQNTGFDLNTKIKQEMSGESKLSRCSEERSAIQTQIPSHRQNNLNKNTPQASKRLILSSAEDTDGGGGIGGMGLEDDDDSDNRQHSIFDIPDDGPYVSMYDKVKARSCKNMQKQEEEKKIKAKFSQLKQSRAKREEKKRSTSYDGDSDSDFENACGEQQKQHNRSGGSYKMLTGGISSTDEERDVETCDQTPSHDRRRSSQASSSAASMQPHRLCSDSDDNSIAQRRLKIQDKLRRLCDDGDETSEDDLIRRHKTGLANKRSLHHSSRIASDSESQSQSAVDLKLKQEPVETSNDGCVTPIMKNLKNKIKKEVDATEATSETSDFGEFKFKGLSSICSSADEQNTSVLKVKKEMTPELLSASEIKKEFKVYYPEEHLQTEPKLQKSPIVSASQLFSPEQTKIKKHKKSKKRQKTPTQDSLTKEQIVADTSAKHSNVVDNTSLFAIATPCYDAFDELKRSETLSHVTPEPTISVEKKRHKERKEKKREKQRNMSADFGSGAELEKIAHEKEKHRLKKSKKSKSIDIMRQTSAAIVNDEQALVASVSCASQHKQRSSGEKMEDIFGPISDEDEDLTDSDIGGRDLNCIPNRNTSSSNMPGPIVSAALNPYKQEPLTPKSHTVEENEENKQKLSCSSIIGASSHLERVAERQHRKEKREKKRREREKSRSSEQSQSIGFNSSPVISTTKPVDDENSVDLDAAGRALEAQLMEDSDNKTLEEATPSTANTYRSDMTDVFLFSDCDENSLEMSSTNKHDKKETEKDHHTAAVSGKIKEKKKKKKRSKEEKQLYHQRRESSSSNASQLTTNMITSGSSNSKLSIDVQAAVKLAKKAPEEHLPTSSSPLCKPSPSLPCLIGDDDEDVNITIQASKITPNNAVTATTNQVCTTPQRSSSHDIPTLTPHMKDKKIISPIPSTPKMNNNSSENVNKNEATTPTTPTSSHTSAAFSNLNTTPTSSTATSANSLNKPLDSSAPNAVEAHSSLTPTTQKKKPDIFIPGFDGEIDEKISESAVQSISAEFNSPLHTMTDEPKIPVESPPDASKLEKLEESTKSRVTISQEETESAVSALLGESFGNSSADYSFNDDDDDGLNDLSNANQESEPAMAPGEPDEEAALAAKAIECEAASSAITDNVEDDAEEVCKAIQSLRQEELDVKADTPQSVRDLQIDTDTEENADEADSSGSHSLKIDENAQSNNSSTVSAESTASANNSSQQTEDQISTISKDLGKPETQKSSVITKVESPEKLQPTAMESTEPKIEPPTITKQDQPAIQPVQDVLQTSASEDAATSTVSTAAITIVSSSSTTYTTPANQTSSPVVTMSFTSTPIKAPLVSSSTVSPATSQSIITSGKPLSTAVSVSSAGYIMQPPTITIPEPGTHFVVPQLVLSPRGPLTSAHHSDSSVASLHSPSGHHLPPQSPVGAAYLMGVRAQSPQSPRQHTSRGNTPTPRQASPHTPTPTTPPIVTPQQQQNIILQRAVQQHQQKLASPPQGHASQSSSPLASPVMHQRQFAQGINMNKPANQQTPLSVNPEQHMIKINNYSTPPAQVMNMVNIRVSQPSPQHHSQQTSPQQSIGKAVSEQQHVAPIGQHILPISVQKMPPVPTHPTIISKVVTVTPQQAQQSMMQLPTGHGCNMFSPPAMGTNASNNSPRQSPQIIQQMNVKTIHQQQQQQQSSQLQFMQHQQQRQQQQQHILQIQQQQIMHQQQKLPQQQQVQHNFVVSQQNKLPSPQQIPQNAQQMKYQQPHQQQMTAPSQSPSHQQNVIQNSSIPQRFLVQQHIIGIPQQQQQQQQQQAQTMPQNQQVNYPQNSNAQQKLSPIFSGKQQQHSQQPQYHQLQQRQQSPSPHRFMNQQTDLAKESTRVIMSNNQACQQSEQLSTTSAAATLSTNVESQVSSTITSAPTTANKQIEAVSVIRTPTPTSLGATKSLPQTMTVVAGKEPATSTSITSRPAPLTEENVIKISAPANDQEQDSKEDSDYWSAKELNVVEGAPNASSVSSVIKKNDAVLTPEMPAQSGSKPGKPSEDIKSMQAEGEKNESKTILEASKTEVQALTTPDKSQVAPAAAATTSQTQSGNVTTDHETEDETETQHMPIFEQVPIPGRPSTRGSGAKRGRQPRGGKKATVANTNSAYANTSINTQQPQLEIGPAAGVQTRLRKPTAGAPVTRGRKGRPPRNLLLQQQLQHQQQQQPQEQQMATTSSSTGTSMLPSAGSIAAADKKVRTLSTASSDNSKQSQHQDIYEFHDESGDEIKTSSISTMNTSAVMNSDQRPRLILTIKSPAPGATHLVKASEKPVNVETQHVNTPSDHKHTTTLQQQETPNSQAEQISAELAAAAITRKSRRLLEKDRSTIDDIIEDVVRNTATNIAGGNAASTGASLTAANISNQGNIAVNTLPKGAQTPPRRSGRNSSQSKPYKTVENMPQTSANPIGRPRKLKDRKNTNDLEIEQQPSPQPKAQLQQDMSDVEDTKPVNTPAQSESSAVQVTETQSTPTTSANSTIYTAPPQQKPPLQGVTTTQSIIPQHPKKKVLAAAEIESYQTSAATTTTPTITPNVHSSIPAAAVPMLNTAAPATQKTTGGAADSVNKPLIDPVTGVVSGSQMQRAKEGNLPSATAASQPSRSSIDPKKMMQAAAAAAAADNMSINSKLQNQPTLPGSVATPVTALTKPVQVEATAAQVANSTAATAMVNMSVSVVVKTTTIPPTPSTNTSTVMHHQQQQHFQHSPLRQAQQRPDIAIPTKQSIIMQQQASSVMHAQLTNVRPPTSLKAHVLNSQKLQQQQQHQQQQVTQQQYTKQQLQQPPQQQQQTQQILQQQTTSCHPGVVHQTTSHIIQNTGQRQTTSTVTTTASQQQHQQQSTAVTKQLLVNMPPSTSHTSHPSVNAINSPRHIPQHSQQQQQQPQLLSSQHSLVIKQAHDLHQQQVLHVVSSKTNAPPLGPNKPVQSVPPALLQQPPNASPHSSYASYIQTPASGHTKQQLPQQPVVIHQQTIGVQSKNTTTPLVIPPGILGLPPHPAMVIQTKTSAPAQSPSSATSHLQHAPSPPLQASAQHLVKPPTNSLIHSIQSQGVQHNLNTAASTSTSSAVKQNPQQSSLASNMGASSLRTAIPTISPQSQAHMGSILLPGGMQVPPHFETSMSEASFPGGIGRVGVPTREHLMIYQQLLRQHSDFDEKFMGSSPPLELRRPGSVPRTVAVPHSLQSPQDRSTDSPQVAQVYVHNTRIPAHSHYDVSGRPAVAAQPSGYYDATRQMNLEPPPAHRPTNVHSNVAPPAVVVPHSTTGSSNPYMPTVSPATGTGPPTAAPSGHHTKLMEREKEQRERDREQQIRADAHNMQVATPPPHQQPAPTHQLPPHTQQPPPPPQADSLLTLLQRYPVMWQGLLALKTDQAAVQMHFVFGNPHVARASLPCNDDGSTPPLRIAQRMRLEHQQLDGVAKKMQFENEHCMLLALPCGRDHADVLQQSRNLQSGFITYLQQKMAAGIVNIPMPGSEQAAYVVHIFPSCDFANENLEKAAPDLKNRVADIAHLLIVIATV